MLHVRAQHATLNAFTLSCREVAPVPALRLSRNSRLEYHVLKIDIHGLFNCEMVDEGNMAAMVQIDSLNPFIIHLRVLTGFSKN
jgi:hypothetical protein